MSDVEIETKQSPACTRLPSEQQTQKVTISGTQSVANNKTQTQKVTKSGTQSGAKNKTQTQKVTIRHKVLQIPKVGNFQPSVLV